MSWKTLKIYLDKLDYLLLNNVDFEVSFIPVSKLAQTLNKYDNKLWKLC